MSFIDELNHASEVTNTENGAYAYKLSVIPELVQWVYNIADNRRNICNTRLRGHTSFNTYNTKLTDSIVESAYRNSADEEFIKVLCRYMAYIRDPRIGLGERSLFRTLIISLINKDVLKIKDPIRFCDAVIHYGRWDDLIAIVLEMNESHEKRPDITHYISTQLKNDLKIAMISEKTGQYESISLLAKWLPSINSKSHRTRKNALQFMKLLNISEEKMYRKSLSMLRKHINIVERNICQNTYDRIDYSNVPALAMNCHRHTFLKHDEDRFSEYLDDLKAGKAEIKTSGISPAELCAAYNKGCLSKGRNTWMGYDTCDSDVVEAQWDKMVKDAIAKNKAQNYGDYLPVIDMSGSMNCFVTSKVRCLDVSIGMGIFMAKTNIGVFKDKALTFADKTAVMNFSDYNTLVDCIWNTDRYSDGYTTNVEDCLMTVLRMAVSGNAKPEEIPTLVFITDCEFNSIALDGDKLDTVFEHCNKKFKEQGYELPRIVFWNTTNRSDSVPMKTNKNGLILLSGFSPNIISMLDSHNMDPLQAVMRELNDPKWDDAESFM